VGKEHSVNVRKNISPGLLTDASMVVLLTLLAVGTRWFFFQGRNSVPFEIQDEAILVRALKSLIFGDLHSITYPLTRFVASYSFVPFYVIHILITMLKGEMSGLVDLTDSYMMFAANATTETSFWVGVPRLVSWLSLVISIPTQYILGRFLSMGRAASLLSSVVLNFSFMSLYTSFFGMPDSFSFLVFQGGSLALIAYVSRRTWVRTVVLSMLAAVSLLVGLQNGLVLCLVAIVYIIASSGQRVRGSWGGISKEFLALAGIGLLFLVVLNPVIYMSPRTFFNEFQILAPDITLANGVNVWIQILYVSRIILDEVLGVELALLVAVFLVAAARRRTEITPGLNSLLLPMLLVSVGMGYPLRLSYETELFVILVPATLLGGWTLTNIPRLLGIGPGGSVRVQHVVLVCCALFVVLFNPILDWLSLYRVATVEGTRVSAQKWINKHIPDGSTIYIAPFTYTAPLIESLDLVQDRLAMFPESELLRWRIESEIGRPLQPAFYLINDMDAAAASGVLPEYFVRTSFVNGPENCSMEGIWSSVICPYNPLRGSLSHFQRVNHMPNDPPDADMVLLREFNPICRQSVGDTVYINYRSNVLRNNVRHLCRIGPVIRVFRLSL